MLLQNPRVQKSKFWGPLYYFPHDPVAFGERPHGVYCLLLLLHLLTSLWAKHSSCTIAHCCCHVSCFSLSHLRSVQPTLQFSLFSIDALLMRRLWMTQLTAHKVWMVIFMITIHFFFFFKKTRIFWFILKPIFLWGAGPNLNALHNENTIYNTNVMSH